MATKGSMSMLIVLSLKNFYLHINNWHKLISKSIASILYYERLTTPL